MRKGLKSVVAPLALVSASVALALGAAEASLRVFPQLMPEEARLRQHWREVNPGTVSRADPYLGFVYPPHHEGRFERDDGKFAFAYTTDEHGFRNPSPWPERAEIVVLGDSMAFGYGVEDEEAWTAHRTSPVGCHDASHPLHFVRDQALAAAAPTRALRLAL